MTWTQLKLKLPGGIEIDLLSVYKPPVSTRPTLPPPSVVITTHGEELPDNVVAFPARRCA